MSVNRIDNASIDVQGFQRIWEISLYPRGNAVEPLSHDNDVRIWLEHGELTLATFQDTVPKQIPLEPLIDQISTKQGTQLPDNDLTIDVTQGARNFRIIFNSLSWRQQPEGIRVENYGLYLLEK